MKTWSMNECSPIFFINPLLYPTTYKAEEFCIVKLRNLKLDLFDNRTVTI